MRKKKRFEREQLKKGIFILPNIFTSLNLFCGFYSIISSIKGDFTAAAWAILVAGIFDLLDGKIARATNTTSKFGVEYDSLADLISFGLAPGLMIYLWALKPMDILGRTAWLAAFLFLACGALRLARFNTNVGTTSSDYFTGLPIPTAAGMNAAIVLICTRLNFSGTALNILVLVMLYVLSFLMVSTIKYNSFKKAELFTRMNFNILVAVILVIIFVAAEPEIALFSIGITYILSGPVTALRHHAKKRAEGQAPSTSENNV